MNDFYLTLGQAAKESGHSKTAIHKALQNGKLSYIEKTTEGYKIDPSELFRVFPKTAKDDDKEQSGTPENTEKQAVLVEKIRGLEDKLEIILRERDRERQQLTDTIEDLKTDRDQWRQQATNLLTHEPEAKPEPQKKTGFLQRLFRGKPPK
jgi:phage terminase small subunit